MRSVVGSASSWLERHQPAEDVARDEVRDRRGRAGRDRDVEHRVLLAQHVLVLGEHRCDLEQAVADEIARALDLLLIVALERIDVDEELLLEAVQEQTRARASPGRRASAADAGSARRCTR